MRLVILSSVLAAATTFVACADGEEPKTTPDSKSSTQARAAAHASGGRLALSLEGTLSPESAAPAGTLVCAATCKSGPNAGTLFTRPIRCEAAGKSPADFCANLQDAECGPDGSSASFAERMNPDGSHSCDGGERPPAPMGLGLAEGERKATDICGRLFFEPGIYGWAWNYVWDESQNDKGKLAEQSCQMAVIKARERGCTCKLSDCEMIDRGAEATINLDGSAGSVLISWEFCAKNCDCPADPLLKAVHKSLPLPPQ